MNRVILIVLALLLAVVIFLGVMGSVVTDHQGHTGPVTTRVAMLR